MLLTIPDVLTREQVAACREIMDQAEWVDGKVTAGHQSVHAKNNMQLPEGSPAARQVGDVILNALSANPLFFAAALPLKVYPPFFNRYSGGQYFGLHVDNAIRLLRGTDFRIRSDLSATLFFCDPEEYDGGELVAEDTYGEHRVKLPAGHLVLYPSTSIHQVTPVTRGARVCSFMWIESMVRDVGERTLLFQLDASIQQLGAERGHNDPAVVQLTGIYHNLVRRWANT
ncbi:MAG TPA: Fe2+-dependent dioxygenase [Azospirillum sp.]|nr:Fe2+-dependent dioxygenase [Azospirillum sp.]